MAKQETYYCVFDANGQDRIGSLSSNKSECIKKFMSWWESGTWRQWKKNGYSVQKVTINIVDDESA